MNLSDRVEYSPITTIIRDQDDRKVYSIFTVYSNIGSPDCEWETYVMKYQQDGYNDWLKTAYAKTKDDALRQHVAFVRQYS